MSWISLGLSVVLFAAVGAGLLLVGHYNGQIHRLAGLITPGAATASAPGAENVLLAGSDSRGALAPGQGEQGTGADYVSGQRSDTIILAHLFAGGKRNAELVSFPRDSYVQIPDYTDPRTHRATPAHMDKINSAFAEGGPRLLIQTVERLTGLQIDHFVQVDFNGFKSIVNTLGGVEVCLSAPAKEHFSGIDLPAGRQTINGDQALAFVRQRHGLANGDLDRIRRQQQFLGAVTRQVLSSGTLLNPYRLNGFLNAVTSAVQVDAGLDAAGLQNLALRLRHADSGGVRFITIPVTNIGSERRTSFGLSSVVLLDPAADKQLFDALAHDQDPAATPPPFNQAALTVAPDRIVVRVINTSGRAGLGNTAAADLRAVGFRVPTPATSGTATSGSGSGTVVRFGPNRRDSARTLLAALPGATGLEDPALGRALQLEVGGNYATARPVTVSAVTGPPRPHASSPAPASLTAAQDPCAP